MSPTSGNVFTINSPSWFHHQGLAAGSKLKLEYMMSFNGQVPNVNSIIFNGEELCTGNSSTSSPTVAPTTTSPSTQSTESTTTTQSGAGGSCSSNTVTNSWANNIQGTLRFTVPSDISEFQIAFTTDIPLTKIRVS